LQIEPYALASGYLGDNANRIKPEASAYGSVLKASIPDFGILRNSPG